MRQLDEKKKKKVMEFNLQYQQRKGAPPSYRDVLQNVGLGSLATVRRYILALENRGFLERDSRGKIEMTPELRQSEVALAPLAGRIVCGQPDLPFEEVEETVALPRSVFGYGELFLLRAKGDSMTEAGIEEKDLLVLRRQSTAEDGEIVVADVDGETTLKRLFRRGGKIILHPENRELSDIVTDSCEIRGVLVSCIKMYGGRR